jgi:hypothetical protein
MMIKTFIILIMILSLHRILQFLIYTEYKKLSNLYSNGKLFYNGSLFVYFNGYIFLGLIGPMMRPKALLSYFISIS